MMLPRFRFFLVFLLLTTLSSMAQDTTGHRGSISALAYDEKDGLIFSAGSDGYIAAWNPDTMAISTKYQVSPYGLTALSLHPNRAELAVSESDGLGIYRVSVWNYITRTRIFSLRFKDAISFLGYSANGTFLLVGRNAPNGVVILNPDNGTPLSSTTEVTGPILFAATGKSERTVVTYAASGELSYWDMTNGSRLERVSLVPDLRSPVLFGNNRYFAGIDTDSVIIFDAVKGKELNRKALTVGATITRSQDTDELFSIESYGSFVALTLIPPNTVSIPKVRYIMIPSLFAGGLMVYEGGTILTLDTGTIAEVENGYNSASAYQVAQAPRYNEAYIKGDSIQLRREAFTLSIPANPDDYRGGAVFYNLPDIDQYQITSSDDGTYIKWRKDGSVEPVLINGLLQRPLPVPTGAPISSVKIYKSSALFLDNLGQLTIIDIDNAVKRFSFSSLGLIDADFIDERKILAAKDSALPPYAALIAIDTVTGETAPLELPGKTAFRLYRGQSSYLYAILIDSDETGSKTNIIRVNPQAPYFSTVLMTYQAEDLNAQLTEVAGSIATNLGGESAYIINSTGFNTLARGLSLPSCLFSYDRYFIILDNEGSLTWYDGETGEIEKTLSIFNTTWTLSGNNGSLSGIIR